MHCARFSMCNFSWQSCWTYLTNMVHLSTGAAQEVLYLRFKTNRYDKNWTPCDLQTRQCMLVCCQQQLNKSTNNIMLVTGEKGTTTCQIWSQRKWAVQAETLALQVSTAANHQTQIPLKKALTYLFKVNLMSLALCNVLSVTFKSWWTSPSVDTMSIKYLFISYNLQKQ